MVFWSIVNKIIFITCWRSSSLTRIFYIYSCPQCHPARDGQRGKCWCVDQKTGLRLPGPLELRGDLDCHQLMTATLRDWGVRSGSGGCRTSWTLLVLISRTTWGKGLALKPRFTWGLLELAQQKGNHWIEFFCYFVSVCESMWNLLSTSCVLFLLCEVKTDSL